MRYTQLPNPYNYVPQYVGNQHPTELLLATGQKLEKDRNINEEKLGALEGLQTPYGYRTKDIATEADRQLQEKIDKARTKMASGNFQEVVGDMTAAKSFYQNSPLRKIATSDAAISQASAKELSDFQKGHYYQDPKAYNYESGQFNQISPQEAMIMGDLNPNAYKYYKDPFGKDFGQYVSQIAKDTEAQLYDYGVPILDNNGNDTGKIQTKQGVTTVQELTRKIQKEKLLPFVQSAGKDLENVRDYESINNRLLGKYGQSTDSQTEGLSSKQNAYLNDLLDLASIYTTKNERQTVPSGGSSGGGNKAQVPIDSNSLLLGKSTEQIPATLTKTPITSSVDLDNLIKEYDSGNVVNNFLTTTYNVSNFKKEELTNLANIKENSAKDILLDLGIDATADAVEALQFKLDLNEIEKNDLVDLQTDARQNAAISAGYTDGNAVITDPVVINKLNNIKAQELQLISDDYLDFSKKEVPGLSKFANLLKGHTNFPKAEIKNLTDFGTELENSVKKEAEQKFGIKSSGITSYINLDTPEKKAEYKEMQVEAHKTLADKYNKLVYSNLTQEQKDKANKVIVEKAGEFGQYGKYLLAVENNIQESLKPIQMGLDMASPDRFGMNTLPNGQDITVGSEVVKGMEGNESLYDYYQIENNKFSKVSEDLVFDEGVQQLNFDKASAKVVIAPTEDKYLMRYTVTPTEESDKEKNKKDASQKIQYIYADITTDVNTLGSQTNPKTGQKYLAEGEQLKFNFISSVWKEIKLLPTGDSKTLKDLPVYLNLPDEVEEAMSQFKVKKLAGDSYEITHPLLGKSTSSKKDMIDDLTTVLNGFSQKYNSGTLGGSSSSVGKPQIIVREP
jgi:hypothetical protein